MSPQRVNSNSFSTLLPCEFMSPTLYLQQSILKVGLKYSGSNSFKFTIYVCFRQRFLPQFISQIEDAINLQPDI